MSSCTVPKQVTDNQEGRLVRLGPLARPRSGDVHGEPGAEVLQPPAGVFDIPRPDQPDGTTVRGRQVLRQRSPRRHRGAGCVLVRADDDVTSLSRTFHSVRCAGSGEGVSRSSG